MKRDEIQPIVTDAKKKTVVYSRMQKRARDGMPDSSIQAATSSIRY